MKNRIVSVLLTLALLLAFVPALTASATVYALGDVNADGKVTSADARLVLRVAAKLEHFNEIRAKAADVNRSGKVNSSDARTTLRVAAKLEKLDIGEDDIFDDGLTPNAKDPANEQAIKDMVAGLNSGRFSLVGSMKSDGETVPMTFMLCDGAIRMRTEMSGIELDMAQLDGNMYLISTGNKTYIEMTEAVVNALGLDLGDLDMDIGQVDVDASVDWAEREYKGRTVECGITSNADGITEFYTEGGKVVQICVFDLNGVCNTEIGVDEFRTDVTRQELEIPADYKKVSFTAFLADMMGNIDQ